MKLRHCIISCALTASLSAFLTTAAHGAAFVWNGGANDGLWNSATNWTGGVPTVAAANTIALNAPTSGNTVYSTLTVGTNYPDTGAGAGVLTFNYGTDLILQGGTNIEYYNSGITVSDAHTYTLNFAKSADGNSGTMFVSGATVNVASGGTLAITTALGTKSGVTGGNINKTGAGTFKIGDGTANAVGQYLALSAGGGTTELGFTSGATINGISSIAAGATVKITAANIKQTMVGSNNYNYQAGVTGVAGTFDLNGFNQTIYSLGGTATTGVVTNSGAVDSILTIGVKGSYTRVETAGTFNGLITDGPTNKTALAVNFVDTTKSETLTAANTYSGTTTVSSGILNMQGGSFANSAVTVNGGTLRTGNGTTTFQNLPMAALTHSSGTVELDMNGSGNDQLTVAGTYDGTGGTIKLTVAGGTPVLPTTVTLLSYGTMTGTNPTITIVGLENAPVVITKNYGTGSNSAITVTFSAVAARNLVWTGTGASTWDIGTSTNWTDGVSAVSYNISDNALFDDNAPGSTSPVLDATITPVSVTFNNNSLPYTLTGNGAITGIATFTKAGSQPVVIATNNTHTGVNYIYEGTVQIGNGGTQGLLGTAEIFNNGALVFNRSDSFVFPNLISGFGTLEQRGTGTTILNADVSLNGAVLISGGTLQLGNGGTTGTLTGTTGVENNGILSFGGSGSSLLAAPVTGTGSVLTNGTGSLVLTSDNIYSGGTTITTGTLQLGNSTTTGSVIGAIVNNGNLSIRRADDYELTNNVSGSGSVTIAGSGLVRLTGTNTYSGETRIVSGALYLDDTSHIPTGSRVSFTGAGAVVDIGGSNATYTLPGLRAVSSLSGTNAITGSVPLIVSGEDLLVGTSATSNVVLDLTALPSFTYNAPAQTISVGSQITANNVTSTLRLAPVSSLTATNLNLQANNGSNVGTMAANVNNAYLYLGTTNTLHVNTINVGTSGRDGGSILYPSVTDPTLAIRAADGTSRANINLGARGTVYGTNHSSIVDLNTNVTGVSTLDALVGNLRVGIFSRGGGQTEIASFSMGHGTLDATSIEVGSIANNDLNFPTGFLVSTFTVNGGTVIAPTVTLGIKNTSTTTITSTINLNSAAILRTQTLAAGATVTGTGTATRKFNWNDGTLANVTGTDLVVTGIPFVLPVTGTRTLSVESGHTATFGTGTVFNVNYDSAILATGGVNANGSAVVLSGATVTLTDTAATPATVASGAKLILLTYTGGSLTGTFGGLAEGATITVGTNTYTLHYADTLGGTGLAVTLVSANSSDPFSSWIDSFTSLTNAADKTKDADPDHDGLNNLAEFALNSDPTRGSSHGKTGSFVTTVGVDNTLVLTLAVRSAAIADPSDPTAGELVLIGDKVRYRIQGSTTNLNDWASEITEVTPAITTDLITPETGWTYRSFRIPGTTTNTAKAFLRAKLEEIVP